LVMGEGSVLKSNPVGEWDGAAGAWDDRVGDIGVGDMGW